jgi:sec-independent protein translocase protein TatA
MFAIGMPSAFELGLIVFIVLIVFGPGRLPQVFEQVGKGFRAFKSASRDEPTDVTPRARELPNTHLSEAAELRAGEIKEKV